MCVAERREQGSKGLNSCSKQQKRQQRGTQANLSFAELESIWVLYCTDSEISVHVTVSELFSVLD